MLPSLTAIKAFESAARHLSFARAASQLGVQAPAVSRQIADLEQTLGVLLFVRSKPRLTLTAQGQELYLAVSIGLNEIRQACDRIRHAPSTDRVTVVTSIGITSCWLLPRLADFYQRFPEIDLQLMTRDSTTNLDPRDADVAVLFADAKLPGVESRRIFRERMITVCAPGLLSHGRPFTPEELVEQPLLHYAEPSHRDDWTHLLASAGVKAPEPQHANSFNSYVVYVQATLNGAGIAIGWEHLLDDYLTNDSLARASSLLLETDRGYFCCLTENGVDNPAALQFRDWICSLASE